MRDGLRAGCAATSSPREARGEDVGMRRATIGHDLTGRFGA